MARNTTHVTVEFGAAAGQGGQVVIEEDYKRAQGYEFTLRAYTRGLYPTIRATVGTVTRLGVGEREVRDEALSFNGSDSATLRYPATSDVHITTTGDTFDENGNNVSVSFHYDEETNSVIASRAIYGFVKARYSAEYTQIGYMYEKEFVSLGTYGGVNIRSTRWIPGSVYVFVRSEQPPLVGSFDIPDYEYTLDDGPQDTIELWRDISYAQVTDRGVYERHRNWPTETFVPDDYDNYVLDAQRTHKIAYMDKLGRLFEQDYSVDAAMPYESNGGAASADGYPHITTQYARLDNPSQTWGSEQLFSQARTYLSQNGG